MLFLDLGVVMNSLACSLCILFIRPVVTIPLSIYSISPQYFDRKTITIVFGFACQFAGFSVIFLISNYFHRAIVLASFAWKKSLITYFTIISFLWTMSNFSSITYVVYQLLTNIPITVPVELKSITNRSGVLLLDAEEFTDLNKITQIPNTICLLTLIATIFLIFKFSKRKGLASGKTQRKQKQLFRITLIQALVFTLTIVIPACALILATTTTIITIPDLCLYFIFCPILMLSPGNCLAIIMIPHYRKQIIQFVTKQTIRIQRFPVLRRKTKSSIAIFVEVQRNLKKRSSY
ncbi:unnamed protein product, partial [Mesorhabditis belari]|uniref:Uncharacterized protein n=1 Tax=Mesorhabditis belari TaxID=2138241 RepID=A0AAF3J815_9BILA